MLNGFAGSQHRLISRSVQFLKLNRGFASSEMRAHADTPPIKDDSLENNFIKMLEERTGDLLKSLGRDSRSLGKFDMDCDTLQTEKAWLHNSTRYYADTQQLYTKLVQGNYSSSQSEILVDVLRRSLETFVSRCEKSAVPKSLSANESYLFDAAKSEIKTELKASRSTQSKQYRFDMARLQRDVEMLEHEAAELTSLLKSELDIDLHERKNVARTEENNIQLRIQELNNKIGTKLSSNLKTEIEQLRWQITRRGIAAIIVASAAVLFITQTSKKESLKITRRPHNPQPNADISVPWLTPIAISDELEDISVEELRGPTLEATESNDNGGITS